MTQCYNYIVMKILVIIAAALLGPLLLPKLRTRLSGMEKNYPKMEAVLRWFNNFTNSLNKISTLLTLIFAGIVVLLILLTAAILMLYFRQ